VGRRAQGRGVVGVRTATRRDDRSGLGIRRLLPSLAISGVVLFLSACGATPPTAPSSPAGSSASAVPTLSGAPIAGGSPPLGPTSPDTASPIATPAAPGGSSGASAPPSASAGPAAIPAASLQRAIEAFARRSGTPGLSVTLRWDDGRTWTGVAGLADAAAAVAVTPDTAFPIASVSKTFTAALVLQLVD
jgi:CubicO group peptidase (beta-lactamase class C family)